MADKKEKREEGRKATTPKEVPRITLNKNSGVSILIWRNRFLQGSIDKVQEPALVFEWGKKQEAIENIAGAKHNTQMDDVSEKISQQVCIKISSKCFL